jgi:hypothetical protein
MAISLLLELGVQNLHLGWLLLIISSLPLVTHGRLRPSPTTAGGPHRYVLSTAPRRRSRPPSADAAAEE